MSDAGHAGDADDLRRELDARREELAVLYEVSRQVSRSANCEELFHLLLSQVDRVVPCDYRAGLLVRPDDAALYVHGSADRVPRSVVEQLLGATRRVLGREVTADRLSICTVGRVETDEAVPPLRSTVLVPLRVEGETVGMLLVGAADENAITEHHVRTLYTIAGLASEVAVRLQDAIAEERGRLRTLIGHLPVGVAMIDCDGVVTTANDPGLRYLDRWCDGAGVGGTVTAIDGVALADFGDGPRLLETGDGGDAPIRAFDVTVIDISDTAPQCWLVIFRDVTDHRRATARRDRFLATAAHELRNPLMAMAAAAEALDGAGREPGDVDNDIVTTLRRQVEHMRRMVGDLLDVARYINGKIAIQRRPVDLRDVVRDAHGSVRSESDRRGHELIVDVPTSPMMVDGDRTRLVQAVTNVLHNAVKYTPPGGRIVARLGASVDGSDDGSAPGRADGDQSHHLTITDNGIGLSADQLERIFEPFEQMEQGLDRSEGGLGLGLPLTREILRLHGGDITAAGPSRGGTRMRLTLPAAAPRTDTNPIPPVANPEASETQPGNVPGSASVTHPSVAPERHADASSDGRPSPDAGPAGADDDASGPARPRVLLVEDNADIRLMLRMVLTRNGFDVLEAADGPSGVDLFAAHTPDAAVIDIGLPGLDGFGVAESIRRRVGPAPLLIALSGYGTHRDRERSAEVGFDAHLTKPPDLNVLIRTLRRG